MNRAHNVDRNGISALIEAARGVKAVRDRQTAYTRQLQQLAAEARRTGKSQSHRIPTAPAVHDYGDCIAALLAALEKVERSGAAKLPNTTDTTDKNDPDGGRAQRGKTS